MLYSLAEQMDLNIDIYVIVNAIDSMRKYVECSENL